MNLPFLHVYRSRGKSFAYYRRGRYRVRLKGAPGSAPFLDAYRKAHAAYGAPSVASGPGLIPKSLEALIRDYRISAEWANLRPATRANYERALTFLASHYGTGLVAEIEREDVRSIQAAAGKFAPSRANRVIAVLSVLLTFAIDLRWRRDNPALGLTKLGTSAGHRAWLPEEVTQFLRNSNAFWRRALVISLCTGQRSQDVIAMTRAAYDGSAIVVVQQKTGAKVWIPCHPTLRAELDRTPPGEHLLPHPGGGQWSVTAFRVAASRAIRAAGLKGVAWHGLRPTAASTLAECGCTDAEIMAITGHTTTSMVRHYTRGAEQKRLASAAIAKFKLRHED